MLKIYVTTILFTSIINGSYEEESILKTAALTDKCIVEIDGKETIKSIGTKWIANNTCIWHHCLLNENGEAYEKLEKEFCFIDCKNEYELRIEPGKCCGTCIQTKCKYEHKLYSIGESWRSKDNCTILQCEEHNDGGGPIISAFQKSCPKIDNCPKKDIYEEDCCLYCKTEKFKPIKRKYSSIKLNNTDDIIFDENYYKNHPCNRKCIENAKPMICEYTFTIEWYETLSKACFNCPKNLTDCLRPHCVYGDGARRSISVINRMMPGPSIEVCENDTIVVDVKNKLLGESTTIHWHGIHQKTNPYMDGVPHISQCPIQPHSTFRYIFRADNVGTHFWHSHTGMQRGDGAFGALIIRQTDSADPQSKLYDFDLPEHKMIVQDWAHETGVSMFASHHHSVGNNKPPNILINGKGRYYAEIFKEEHNAQLTTEESNSEIISSTIPIDFKTDDNKDEDKFTTSKIDESTSTTIESETLIKSSAFPSDVQYFQSNPDNKMKYEYTNSHKQRKRRSIEVPAEYPLEIFNVVKDYRYRFRIINAEFLNCPIAISVDNHTLLAINSDGFNLEPIEVQSIVTYAGERFDFIIEANQPIGNYWIRLKGLMDCDQRFTKAFQVAILRYEGAQHKEPAGKPNYDYTPPGIELNSLNKGPGHVDSLTIAEINSLETEDDDSNDEILKVEPDFKFFIYYDFYAKNNPQFFQKNLYGFNQITNTNITTLFTPQLNHISLKMPSLPLMPARDQIDESQFCNASSLTAKGIDCRNEFCECSHVLQVPLGAIVEMILIDEGFTYDANHPFHLHGNAFRVIGLDRIGHNVTVETIRDMDEKGLLNRKRSRAPTKDTITVPDGGYTIIRFKANNPGYWLLHCHIEFHAEIGMALVLKVGQNHEMVPVPKNFPTCFDYIPNLNEMNNNKNNNNGDSIPRISLSLLVILFILKLYI